MEVEGKQIIVEKFKDRVFLDIGRTKSVPCMRKVHESLLSCSCTNQSSLY